MANKPDQHLPVDMIIVENTAIDGKHHAASTVIKDMEAQLALDLAGSGKARPATPELIAEFKARAKAKADAEKAAAETAATAAANSLGNAEALSTMIANAIAAGIAAAAAKPAQTNPV
jgi:hypothetical protein